MAVAIAAAAVGCAKSDASRDATGVIVVSRGAGGHTYVMNADGSDRRFLERAAGEPSPDGQKVAIVEGAEGRSTEARFYVANADGSGRRLVAHLRKHPGDSFWISWSPDGTKLAYEASNDGIQETYLVDVDGSTSRKVVTPGNGWGGDTTFEDWSADGTRLLVSNAEGGFGYYIVDIESMHAHSLPFLQGSVLAWLRNGRILYSVRARHGRAGLVSVRPDGTGERVLAAHLNPTRGWLLSPDERFIGVVGLKGVRYEQLFIVSCEGRGVHRALPGDEPGDTFALQDAAWSPDGSKIAFRSSRDHNTEVYVANVDGTGLTNVSRNTAFDVGPVWAPDGRKLAFASDRDGNTQIYVVNADGSGLTNISRNDADEYPASWLPRRG
jgi:dipeptidyl aminopeptidase/acylaminoacyl peptidase